MSSVEFRDVTLKFGKVVAVRDLSFRVEHNQFFVLIGPSGCGKTSTLRLIAGLETPTSGQILMDDQDMEKVPVGKRSVHMVYQNYALWPHMKVGDEKGFSNLSLPLRIRNWLPEQIRNRMSEISAKVGLEERLFARRPHQLSAGQQQRVAVARSLITYPKVLLMDEPLANLDPPSRYRVREEIRKLHDDLKLTTIYVTHDMSDAYDIADMMGVMNEGTLVQVAPPKEIWEHPADAFVADFVRVFRRTPLYGPKGD